VRKFGIIIFRKILEAINHSTSRKRFYVCKEIVACATQNVEDLFFGIADTDQDRVRPLPRFAHDCRQFGRRDRRGVKDHQLFTGAARINGHEFR
jgi:hypothetical protein